MKNIENSSTELSREVDVTADKLTEPEIIQHLNFLKRELENIIEDLKDLKRAVGNVTVSEVLINGKIGSIRSQISAVDEIWRKRGYNQLNRGKPDLMKKIENSHESFVDARNIIGEFNSNSDLSEELILESIEKTSESVQHIEDAIKGLSSEFDLRFE